MSTYIDTIIKFELAFGFAFELPLVVFYLVIFDVIPYKKLRGSWRTVYVALMVISAMAHAGRLAGHHAAHVRGFDSPVRDKPAHGAHRFEQAHQEADGGP